MTPTRARAGGKIVKGIGPLETFLLVWGFAIVMVVVLLIAKLN